MKPQASPSPATLILVGVICLVLGAALPLLMMLKVLPSTYFLNLVAYLCQLVGLVAGMAGLFSFVRVKRTKPKDDDIDPKYR